MNKVLWIIELFLGGISPIGAPDGPTIFPERGWLAVNSWKKKTFGEPKYSTILIIFFVGIVGCAIAEI